MTTTTMAGLHVQVLQEKLLPALAAVNRIAGVSHLPVTQSVLLTATEGVLTLRATNLQQAISVTVGAKCEGTGAVLVEAAKLYQYVSTFAKDRIDLTVTDRTLLIACGRTKGRFPLTDTDEFPPAPKMAEEPLATMDAGALRTAIRAVLLAVSTDTTRPVLTGAFVELDARTAQFTSANGFQLITTRLALASGPETERELLIPGAALRELDRLLGGDAGTVEIAADSARVRFRVGATELTTQLIAGVFPRYRALIPPPLDFRVTVGMEELTRAVRNCAVMGGRDKDDRITVRFEALPGEIGALRLWSGEDADRANETIIDAVIEGEPPSKIALAEGQMGGVLGGITGKVTLEWSSFATPAVFVPVVGGREAMMAVVMPIFVQW